MPESNVTARRPRRKKIAILGGGLGGLAAAFELTNEPRWFERYEIAVYQKGWRLGGKGASGRGEHGRIEEHGLHCFWGFYDNAFDMLRRCYEEADRKSGPIRTIDEAFRKLSAVWFIDRKNGAWRRYQMHFPENSATPGTDKPGKTEWLTEMSVPQLVAQYFRQVRDVLDDHADVKQRFSSIIENIEDELTWLEGAWRNGPSALATDLWKAIGGRLRQLIDSSEPASATEVSNTDEDYRREVLFDAVQLAFVIALGLVRDGVPTSLEEFDDERFDGYDLRAWLEKHGAPARLLRSQVITGLYNASFCYPGGDFSHGNLSAGVSLRTLLLMGFTYKGSFMWKMQASMGDIVFAPLYEALKRRGEDADRQLGTKGSLRFEFFHKVEKLAVGYGPGGARFIDAIHVAQQVKLANGTYDPLVDIRGLPCWPAKPRYEQIVDGDVVKDFDLESDWCTLPPADRRVLRRGDEDGFDDVVLAIPVGALRTICADLVKVSPAWASMVEEVKTIRTKSFQVWLKSTPAQGTWQSEHRIMTDVYENDFNSVADMYQTLPFEDWPAEAEPGGVMYFSTAMADDPKEPPSPDDRYPRDQTAMVEKQARDWLFKWQEGILGWCGPDYDPSTFVELYPRANVNHDERYVLSVAKSTKYRLAPDQSGFDNLFLAGDWTRSKLNLGCAEGATMSGLEAGRSVLRALTRGPSSKVVAQARFAEYPGMPVFPPTYHQKDITLFQFALEANPERMNDLVDRLLNPSAGERPFQAFGKWVLLQSGYIGSNASDSPWSAYGTGAETSLSFLIPVVRWNGWGGQGTRPIDIGFFAPWVFVDHPLSLVAGREVLGMAKQLGVFESNGGKDARLDDVTLRTMAVHELGPRSPIELLPLVQLKRQTRDESTPASFGLSDLVERSVSALAGAGGLVEKTPLGWIGGSMRRLLGWPRVPFFSLRQLRDGKVPTRAAFQELTRASMSLGNVSMRRPSYRHTIEIVDQASHPIAQELGLGRGPLTPAAELEVHVAEATLERDTD